jgi:hypothetical protein
MLNLMLITGDPEVARYAFDSGIGTIFVDLERLGKAERQGGRDTVMNSHTLADAAAVRAAAPRAQLLVRLDPPHEGTSVQAREALDAGADLLMLPMWRAASDVASLGEAIGGRPCVVPLAETSGATRAFGETASLPCVAEMYVGLNDLHLALGMRFMFQPLAEGVVDEAACACRAAGRPFGFGGLARLGQGALDPRLVLAEHARLGSSRVILSRAFHGRSVTLEDFRRAGLPRAVREVREVEARMAARSPDEIERDRLEVARRVAEIVSAAG